MKVSKVRYPTFKAVSGRCKSVLAFAAIVMVELLLAARFEVTMAAVFAVQLLYGWFARGSADAGGARSKPKLPTRKRTGSSQSWTS